MYRLASQAQTDEIMVQQPIILRAGRSAKMASLQMAVKAASKGFGL